MLVKRALHHQLQLLVINQWLKRARACARTYDWIEAADGETILGESVTVRRRVDGQQAKQTRDAKHMNV